MRYTAYANLEKANIAKRKSKNVERKRGEAEKEKQMQRISSCSCFSTVPLAHSTNGSLTTLATRARNGNEKMHTLQRKLCSLSKQASRNII